MITSGISWWFLDRNKRTAVIFANHILIKSGYGLLVGPSEKVTEYESVISSPLSKQCLFSINKEMTLVFKP